VTSHTFARWVEPMALQLRDGRRQIVEVAQAIPPDAWGQSSPVEGWTYKDVVSHLAAGDVFCQIVLTAVASGGELDLRPASAEREARTARIVEERRSRTVDELIAEVESEGQETQELLARLTGSDEVVEVYTSRSTGAPMSLAEFLRVFPMHDREHLAHLRSAREAAR
jgi:uncharacterized protein (TIGR03083 family)